MASSQTCGTETEEEAQGHTPAMLGSAVIGLKRNIYLLDHSFCSDNPGSPKEPAVEKLFQ